MLLLVDSWNEKARLLRDTLLAAGITPRVVSVLTDGFLPEGVVSAYEDLIGGAGQLGEEERPLYFNEVKIPPYWEIRGTAQMAQILDYDVVRGRIFYKDGTRRLVKIVDWVDRSGKVRSSDHYNKYGWRFAQTLLDADQRQISKTYYTKEGQDRITEDFRTGQILVTAGGRIRSFPSKSAFILYYLQLIGAANEPVIYNSLSTPFFVSRHIGGGNILFWQEEIGEDLPGNMKALLTEPGTTSGIAVQSKAAYERIAQLLAGKERIPVLPAGFTYSFVRQNRSGNDALILTNSDQIRGLSEIAEALPELQLHVAALTEMSPKLLSLGELPNVHLYPNVKDKKAAQLFERCDYYLDINAGGEILDAVHQAFLNNMILLGYEDVAHRKDLIPAGMRLTDRVDGGKTGNSGVVSVENGSQNKAEGLGGSAVDQLIDTLQRLTQHETLRLEALSTQRDYAMHETPESFLKKLEELSKGGLLEGDLGR